MPLTRALIVDDSRTAQHRLKKLLTRYQLEVDMATSAEEALGYLSYRMPSVIFMDHHMEGMDGFEALKIIKANPTTATIPVIMYTSKSDEVYAGQAHALGALDTLSKNLMKPSRIEEVLSKLNIFPRQKESKIDQVDSSVHENVVQADFSLSGRSISEDAPESKASAGELKAQIARLFELHIADVRTQITENTKFIVRRLTGEIKNTANQETRVDDVPVSVIDEQARAETSKIGLVSNFLLCLILLALTAISFQHFQSQKQIKRLENNYEYLADLNYQENLLLDDVITASGTLNANSAQNNSSTAALLDIVSWAIGIDSSFEYGEQPLSERQVLNLQNLMFRLQDAGFKGFVEINIHFGNYCVTQQDGGAWVVAAPDTPIANCTFMREQKADYSADNYASVPYLQFEQTAAPIQNGDIEFIINVSAFEAPQFNYPDINPRTTAGQWNMIAKQNQRIVLSFEGAE